jgi:hypothetical protein
MSQEKNLTIDDVEARGIEVDPLQFGDLLFQGIIEEPISLKNTIYGISKTGEIYWTHIQAFGLSFPPLP